MRNKNSQTTWEKYKIVAVSDKVAFEKFGSNLHRVSTDELWSDERSGEKEIYSPVKDDQFETSEKVNTHDKMDEKSSDIPIETTVNSILKPQDIYKNGKHIYGRYTSTTHKSL